jgi:putative sigma-54 modulation protein
MKIQIQSLHFNADQKLLDFIGKRMNKLETFYDRVIGSDVILSMEQMNTQVKSKVVTIKAHIPGTVLIAKERSKKFEEAIDMATESIRRQMMRLKSRKRSNLDELDEVEA